MMTLGELRRLSSSLDATQFERQLGPFALIERPADPEVQRRALALGAYVTAPARRRGEKDHTLLFSLDALVVALLPPVSAKGSKLLIGRLPDCDLVIDDPSVSKRHAELTWSALGRRCDVIELGSTNGTYVNEKYVSGKKDVRDGDVLRFGDHAFLFLHAATLLDRLRDG